jgi:putative flippase GtrA
LDKRFIKFLFVGGINTVFGYALYALFIYLGMHYSLAVLLGTIIGIMFNFKTTGKFVFRNNNNSLIFKFVGVYIITYCLNVAALSIFDHYHFDLYAAGLFLLLPMALISYVLNSRFVFKENSIHAVY